MTDLVVFDTEDAARLVAGTHDRDTVLRELTDWCRSNEFPPLDGDTCVEFGWFVPVEPSPGYDIEYQPALRL